MALHLLVLAVLVVGFGVRFDGPEYLALSNQFLALGDLADRLGPSLWDLWSQPPLYNLLIGVAIKASRTYCVELLWLYHIGCSLAAIWAIYGLGRLLSGKRWVGLALGVILPLTPAWLLYENWANYTFPAAAYLLWVVYPAIRYQRTGSVRDLALLAGMMNLLMLSRSAFLLHGFGIAVLFCVFRFNRPDWRRVILILVIPTLLLTGGWYAKNKIQFGFFGPSGWSGMGLMKVLGQGPDPEKLRPYFENTPQAYLYPAWKNCPAVFCDLVEHYFFRMEHPRKGTSPSLYDLFKKDLDGGRLHRNLNNINFLVLGRDYGAVAGRIIRAEPLLYLHQVLRSYAIYTGPSNRYGYLKANRERIEGYLKAVNRVFYRVVPGPGGSVRPLFYLYPVVLLICLAWGARAIVPGWYRPQLFPDLLISGIISYAVLVSCLADLGENHRFSFMALPLLTTWLVARGSRILEKLFKKFG